MKQQVTLEQLQQALKQFNLRHYTKPKDSSEKEFLKAAATSSIRFFSDGSCDFIDRSENILATGSLDSIYEWIVANNE